MPADVPTLLTGLCSGQLDVELLGAFPVQDAADRAERDKWVAKAEEFGDRRVDPEEIDYTGGLPEGLIDALRREGFSPSRSAASWVASGCRRTTCSGWWRR